MPAFGQFASVVLIAAATVPLCAQQPPHSASQSAQRESAHDLVREVIDNELHDRERDSHWEYRSEYTSPAQNPVREQVETDDGPVFRVIARGCSLLDAQPRQREDERVNSYIQDPGEIARVRRAHQEDEARLASIMQLLPQAFLFEYESTGTDDVARISFDPDPAFVPSSYEARIIHALTGTITVNMHLKRMIDMHGVIAVPVDFGYGLLGHIEKGGSFEIHRRQVSAMRWKTDLVDVHIQGKILMLKTVGKDQREVRSDFRPVPSGTTLAEARDMLMQAAGQGTQARLQPAGEGPK